MQDKSVRTILSERSGTRELQHKRSCSTTKQQNRAQERCNVRRAAVQEYCSALARARESSTDRTTRLDIAAHRHGTEALHFGYFGQKGAAESSVPHTPPKSHVKEAGSWHEKEQTSAPTWPTTRPT